MQADAQPAVPAPVNQVLGTELHQAAPQRRLEWKGEAQVVWRCLVSARRVGQCVERQRGGLQLHGLSGRDGEAFPTSGTEYQLLGGAPGRRGAPRGAAVAVRCASAAVAQPPPPQTS
jgi:hypothetical protein